MRQLKIQKIISDIKGLGAKAGIALNPKTSLQKIEPYLEHLDLVLLMSVEAGFGGQAFIESSSKKVAELQKILHKKSLQEKVCIEVDGGVNAETGALLVQAGAKALVAGSYIYNQAKLEERIKALQSLSR